MQLYGNRLWNDVTDNRHKAYFVMQDDIFRAVTERLDAEGLNYYAFEQNGTYKMAVNEHDLRYFRDVIGDRLIEQMDRTSTTRSNAPQTIIGTTEYRGIQNKRYFTSDIDMVLKIAEHLQQQNVPFSGRVYDDHATITVSAEHEAAVLEVNNRVLAERQQHRHAVSQHMVVGSVPYQDIQQPYHFSSHIKPQEFMQVKPILDAAEIPYSGIVKNNGIILTVDQRNAQQFGILLNAAQTKRQSIDELKEAGFSDHQIALMDPALDRFAEANDYESITSFVDPRFADEQILYITDAAARYIVQSEADRLFDRSGILLDMIHYRDAALRQIEFDEAFRDTAYSPEQRQALQSLCDTGITPATLRESLDESYSVEEMQRLGACFRDSDVDGLRKIQKQHTAALALVGFDPEPDDLAQTVYMRETEAEMQRDIPAGAWQEIAASEEASEEPATAGDTFQIYRLKEDQNELRIRFENYDTLEQMGFVISADKYDSIYTGALTDENATLNGIYETFNINHPADFNGYSLSVGDIIVTNRDGERTAHMVDSIGFRELPDFFLERQEPQQDAADRQPDLFDLPYSDRDKQVIGNTPFRYIAGKTYHKLDTETAKQIAQELAAQEIKFSGRIKGDTTTLTIPAESEERYQEIAARFIVPEVPEIPEQPEEPAQDTAPGQPLELHIGDHIRMADDPQNAWIVTEVSDFILKLENADQKALASAQMMTGWQKHLDSSNVTILPEKGLPAPAPPKKRSAHLRKQAEGQLSLFGEPEPTAPDRRRELLLKEVGRGTGFENGKLRVYDCIHEKQATAAELADFLKKEFGIGGHSGPDMPDVSHDSKGIVIIDTDKKEYRYSWSEAAKAVTELDRQGQYLTAEDIEEAIESSKYYLNEILNLSDSTRAYHENMLARLENHPLRNVRAAEPEQTAPEMPEPAEEAPAVPEPVEVARTSDGLIRFMLCEQREPAETPWNAQRWSRNSTDEDFRYNGFGRFAATEQEARAFIANQFNRYENRECADAIREAVNRNYHYEESHFDSAQALKEVQEHYPTDRIALLLAAEVQNADWDGRYSGDVRDWSRKELKLHDAEEIRLASEIRSYPHPGLMNMLAQEVMEQQNARAIEEPEIAEPQAAEPAPASEQPVKIRNTMEHRIFLRMRDLYPEVIKDAPTAHNYEHYENPNEGTGYEPFAIQRLTDWNNGQCLVSMMHTYEQNGDLMRDPDIVLRVDLTQQTATAISYQQDGLGIYREYPDGSYGQRDTNRFMLTWLKNLRDQEREITHAEVEYTHEGTQYSIDLNYEGGELREVLCDGHPEVERAFAKAIGRQMDELDAAADAARTETPSDRAVRLINAYTQTEFQQDADYSDMSHVDLAAVNDKESGLPIEVYADLESYQIIRTLGGTVISEQQYDSLDDMCENALEYLDFNSLTDIDASEREKAQQPEKPVFSGEFRVGDLFRYERREAEVTQLSGLNPGEVTIAIHDKSTKLAYSVIQNISRDTLIREGEYLGNRLELSPAAQFLMNAENMPSFIDRMYARDEMDTIISRILDNGENAAAVAQETIKPYSHYMSDQETFELTEFGIQKKADDVTFTAEPDSEHPFSVTYSWEQVGDFLRQAAQLQRDVNREAEQAWEREVAESIEEPAAETEELDPEAMAVRAQEIERTIQMTQRRIDNYDPAIHTPEKLQEWKDMLDYLQSDTPDNIELTSEGLQAFLEKRDQQNRAEAQQRFPEMLFTGTLDGFNAVMTAARTDAFSDVGTTSLFDGETVVSASLTEKASLADVQSLIRTAAENGCYLTAGAVDQLKERFGDNFMPELPLNGTFQIPQSSRHLDITAVRSFTMTDTYGQYEGGIDSNGHERMDNFSRRTESVTFAYQGGGIVESQHYSGSEFQQYPDIEVFNIYDPVQRERMIADMQQFADKSDYLNTDIEPASDWTYYIIPDMKTWSQFEDKASELEPYITLDEAVARFNELRPEPYNDEVVYGSVDQNLPLARLTLGVRNDAKHLEFDLIQVRGGQNHLLADYTKYDDLAHDEELQAAIRKIADRCGIDSMLDFQRDAAGKDVSVITPYEKGTERNYVLFLNDHGQTVQFGEVFDTLEAAQDAGNLAIQRDEARGYAVLNMQEQKVEVYDSDFPMTGVFSEEVYANSPFQTLTVHTDVPFRAAEKTDFTIGENFTVAAGEKGKFKANMDAIRTLKTVEAENRTATPEEQKILAGYVGWGGIQNAFDPDKEEWAKEYTELRSVLTDEEYAAARASTENAHYTQPMIISEMYHALEQFGFSGGRVLEPSMGTGNFFGTMPEAMRSSSELYGVELDSISGRIAKQLYPSADIEVTGFEHTHFNDNAFDVVVGNVPFGNYRVMDAAYDEQKFKIHDYFLAKSVDKLKAGGIMACVTSSGTMDKMDASARMYLAERAELIGAVRLPNNAFKANAGTDVTTDILFFQKREEPLGDKPYPEWTMLSETENGLRINSYFKEHPEMVLGTLEKSTNPFSSSVECVPVPGADLRQQLSEALGRLSAEINREPVNMDVRSVQFTDDAPLKTYFMREGNLYFKDSADKPAEISELSGKKRDRVVGMIGIRDAARAVVQAQTENCSDEELHKLQAVLNERYDAFYKKNGLIHSKANATVFREDDGFALICSLEKDFDLKNGTLENKADIFTKRTICQFSEVEHADTAEDALIVSMQYRGRIDFPYMEQLCGKSRQEMISDLGDKIFPVPDLAHPDRVSYQPADEYLSGNIRQKLDEARVAASQNPMFERNIPALEKVLPPKLRAGDIKVRLGATWIKPEYIRQFMYETLETPRYYQAKDRGYGGYRGNTINVEYVPEAGLWHVSNPKSDTSIKATRDFGTKELTAYQILDDVLNLRSPKVYMTVPDPGSERGEKRVLDGEATSLAQKKAAALQQAFENWVFKDPERAADLVETYNDKFNSMRPREYDGSHLIFPGMAADIKLREHQRNAIAHALYGGNALFAHCVGAGKTYEMIATAMEGKRLGMHHKSLFVVPKHLTSQIGEDFLRLYPSANILVATTKDFKASNRRELMARIATGNYDAVIISHDQFKALPLSAERATRQMQQEVDTLTDSIDRERAMNGGKSFTVKALERQRRALQQQIEKLVTAAKKDQQNVTFEQLGIDHIFVDEAHEFKNLLCPTKLQNLTGISNSASQKAMDLFLKCRYLDEETGSRGVTLATGTPISNSITEIHTMLRYLAHDTLEEHGLAAFDAFISTFGAPKTDWELSPTGTTWRQKTRMAGFDNMPELQSLWRAAADVQTAETLHLPTPDCEMHIVEAKPTQLQQELMQELSDRADEVQAGGVDSHIDNNLLITGDGRKVGLDPRLVDPTLEDNPNTKLNLCVDNVFRIWSETAEKRSTQLIFCDLGVPHKKQQQKADAPETEMTDQEMTQDADDDVSIAELFSLEEELPFCVYDDIKDKLVARGVPAEEIAFIHEAKTETQKSALFEKVRNGDVRVLIGSTPKMGTGTNVQDKLIALHDLDIPWRPADLEQRRGRMVRQGNENDKVHLFRYVTTGTFDAVSYQTLEAKQKFIGQVMTNQAVGRSCEDIDQSALSYAQIKAACTGDTRFKEKMQLETDVQTLRLQRTEHLNTQDEMREKVAKLPDQIQAAEQKLTLIRKDYDSVSVLPRDDQGIQFSIDINGETLTDKTEAAKRVAAYFSAAAKNPGQDIMVGNFCGFPLSINCQMNHIFATLHGQTTHTAELSMSTSYIVRGLQDIVNGIGRKLQKQTRAIAEMKVDLQQAQERADQPFPLEAELTQKSERLATLSDALRKEAMARMKDGGKQGRQTFYFDRNRRNELRNAAKQAGQKPQEKQNSKDALAME